MTTRPRSSASSHVKVIGMVVLAALVLVGIVAATALPYMNAQSQTCTVESKDRTRDAEGKSDMRVYTDDCGVFQVQDMLFAGEFKSADTFSKIKDGQTYEIKSTGFRLGILSLFPTIREISPIEG